MTQRSNSPLVGNSDATQRPYQVSNDWVFNICEALSHIHKNVKIRKFFASPKKVVKCSYNSFALTPRYYAEYIQMHFGLDFIIETNIMILVQSVVDPEVVQGVRCPRF